MIVVALPDVAATHRLGLALGQAAAPGCVAALHGDLGAGKTTLAQGVGAGLGVLDPVVSPTFGLVHLLDGGRVDLVHADLYRLDDPHAVEEIGLEELLEGGAVGLVEWAERAPHVLPVDHLAVTLLHRDTGREARLVAHGPRSRAWLLAAGHG